MAQPNALDKAGAAVSNLLGSGSSTEGLAELKAGEILVHVYFSF